ncbi:MAG: Fur family transcriptional regulator [Clostridium sp.]|uniref:Fur family transcriptional regulator n=1 Tax=Clostridium sp. TaxID=1506 RepID=UPI003F306E1B
MDVLNILKDKGIKVTKARLEILTILKESKESISADKIFDICREENININLSTVYRTLEAFLEKNIVDKFILEDGVAIYRPHKVNHKHLLECDICHKEVELTCPMIQIEEIISRQTGFTLTEHNLQMKGVCDKCKKTSQK